MAREFDRKEAEREEYVQHHSSTRHLNSRIAELEAENEELKDQIADLKLKLQFAKDKL